MYICPKFGGKASKERIKVDTYSENITAKTGDLECNDCGYKAPNEVFERKEKDEK